MKTRPAGAELLNADGERQTDSHTNRLTWKNTKLLFAILLRRLEILIASVGSYLEEKAERNPLVEAINLYFFFFSSCVVHSREGNLDTHLLVEGAGHSVRRVNPAERVQQFVWFFVQMVYASYWFTNILIGS